VFSLAEIAYVEICMKCNIYQYHAWFISCMFKSFCWMTIFDFILVFLFFFDLLLSSENFLDLDSMVLNCNFDCAPNIYIMDQSSCWGQNRKHIRTQFKTMFDIQLN
jgi:hypothetical protein